MPAQYDTIARQYRQTRSSPLRRFVEAPSLFAHLGELQGRRILDLACGDGFYSRALVERGAAEVVGVDVSAAMIEAARVAERECPLGIEYHCADAARLPADLGRFDIVLGAYLLHYASDVATLERMCTNIVSVLRPGGFLLALNENPDVPVEPHGCYARYGFSKTLSPPLRDGARIRYRMMAGREAFSFDVHYFGHETYRRVCTQAGFVQIEWCELFVSPDGVDAMGEEYFRPYLRHPPVLPVLCRT